MAQEDSDEGNSFLRTVVSWAVATLAIALLILHSLPIDWIQVDVVSLGLLALILLIPSAEYIRKLKVGQVEAEIGPREVREVRSEAAGEIPAGGEGPRTERREGDLLELTRNDPQLGLAKLRIEIEKILRATAGIALGDDARRQGPGPLLRSLEQEGVVSEELGRPLKRVMDIANRAVHGERIRQEDAEDIVTTGRGLLGALWDIHDELVTLPEESRPISPTEAERLCSARYRVVTIVPLVEEPRRNVRVLNQEGLDALLEGYGDYAEFIVEVKPVAEEE